MSQGEFDFVAFTRITKDRPLYERDAMNAVCLPEGALMSLSYRRTWIGQSAWQTCTEGAKEQSKRNWLRIPGLSKGLSKVRGKRVLIVLFEPDAQPDMAFLPLRLASIETVDVHEHLASKFAAGAAVEPGVTLTVSLAERPSEGMLKETAEVLAACGIPVQNRPLALYLLEVDEAKKRLAAHRAVLSSPSTWQRHVELLAQRARSFQGPRYWAIFGSIRPVFGARVGDPVGQLPGDSTRVTTYALRGGSTYEMGCYIFEGSIQPWSETPILASVVGAHAEVSPAGVSQFGASAIINFLIATQRKFSPEIVGMNFSVMHKEGEKLVVVPRGKAPEFHCRVEIGPPPLFWFISFGLFALSAILLSVTADTLKDVDAGLQSAGFLSARAVPLASATYGSAALIAKALGGVIAAGASVFALRKMPIGK